jgi:hypothetical protein
LGHATWYNNALNIKELGKKTSKCAAEKQPEALFDLDTDANSFATIHECHLKPTFNLDGEEEDREELASAANASLAMPPGNNPNKDATRNNALSATISTLRDEEVGEKHAADGR